VKVESGGTGVVAHVGLHALGSFADRLGLGDALSARIPWAGGGVPLHDRGKVLVQTALMLAGGGEACSDIEHLRLGENLFGAVPSDTTVFRTFHEITSSTRPGIADAMAEMRGEVWRRSSLTTGTGPVVLDIDASLVEIHSEHKEEAAATHKGGFGFHPLFVFADLTGETLAAKLRAGNAGANTVSDHVELFDAALAQLPASITKGHRTGDDPTLATRRVIARADGAGCTKGFFDACRERNVTFFVSARSNAQIWSAIHATATKLRLWRATLTQQGERNNSSSVCEMTALMDLSNMPEGTRCIVRREPLHPGAQRSLFPSSNSLMGLDSFSIGRNYLRAISR
jgi:hypothetical protein